MLLNDKNLIGTSVNNDNIIDLRNFNNERDFQKFIDENKILNSKDFKARFPSICNRMYTLKVSSKINYSNPLKQNYSGYDTIEDIQKFVEEHNIQSPTDFEARFSGLYQKLRKIDGGFMKVIYPNRITVKPGTWLYLKTIEDFQKFVDENNIQSPRDFEKNFSGVYDRLLNLKLHKFLKYPKRHTEFGPLLETLINLENFQNYVDEGDFKSPGELRIRNKESAAVYKKASRNGFLRKLNFKNKITDSSGEILIKKILRDNNIKFEEEKSFDWLIYKGKQRLDIFIPELNLGIEVHGEQHFTDRYMFTEKDTFELRRERDVNKYNLCIEHGVKLEYVALTSDPNWKDKNDISNYFVPVYELTEKNILNIINKYKSL